MPSPEKQAAMEALRFADLAKANSIRCVESFGDCSEWTVSDWAVAMAGEAGEVCDAVKKLRRVECNLVDKNRRGPHTREEAIKAIGEEIADTVIYCDLLAQHLRLDLGCIVAEKFNEVSERVGSPHKLPAPIIEREKRPECAGPNASAFDCPVHDPRKRETAEGLLERVHDRLGGDEGWDPEMEMLRQALALIRADAARVERAIEVLKELDSPLLRSTIAILEGREP